jgi:hypothetical protein
LEFAHPFRWWMYIRVWYRLVRPSLAMSNSQILHTPGRTVELRTLPPIDCPPNKPVAIARKHQALPQRDSRRWSLLASTSRKPVGRQPRKPRLP